MERNPITPTGYKQLLEDLRYCKQVERPGVVKDIEEARAHGDISENSEYEDAKERQALIEGKMARLEQLAQARARRLGPHVSVAMIVADHQSGEILAHVGSPDLLDEARRGHVDMTRALRSPGCMVWSSNFE